MKLSLLISLYHVEEIASMAIMQLYQKNGPDSNGSVKQEDLHNF